MLNAVGIETLSGYDVLPNTASIENDEVKLALDLGFWVLRTSCEKI